MPWELRREGPRKHAEHDLESGNKEALSLSMRASLSQLVKLSPNTRIHPSAALTRLFATLRTQPSMHFLNTMHAHSS